MGRINTLLRGNGWEVEKTPGKWHLGEKRLNVRVASSGGDPYCPRIARGQISCPYRTSVGWEGVHPSASCLGCIPSDPTDLVPLLLGVKGVLIMTGMKCGLRDVLSWLKGNKTAIFLEHLSLWTEIHICYTRISTWLIDLRGKYWSFTPKANIWVSPNENRNCINLTS